MKTRLKHAQTLPVLPCTLVTGATSGIGLALVELLAARASKVIALGRSADRLQSLSDRFQNVTPVCADLTSLRAVQRVADLIATEHPGLRWVIHNAGVQFDVRFDSSTYQSADIVDEVNVNLLAPMVMTHRLLPALRRVSGERSAKVALVTSGLGYVPKATAAVYSASKGGLHLFAKAMRAQMEADGIDVVEVVMPLVDTPMTAGRGRNKISAQQAASELLAGLERGQSHIGVGAARWLPWALRLAPGLVERLMLRS